MATHKRVLLLGPTGVDKNRAIERLGEYAAAEFGQTIRYIDFEEEFLKPAIASNGGLKNFFTFLAHNSGGQAAIWEAAWSRCAKSFDGDGILVLGLHASYVSGIVGLRCPAKLSAICETFAPTLVVTLIDDVQNMWFRTEERAGGREARGRPSLEQLLMQRRAEQLLGDMVVTHSHKDDVRHVLVATSNALVALANLVVFDADVTYLSFPISVPREMSASGDPSFMNLIDKLHKMALGHMRVDRKRAFITPLAIDELPMLAKWRNAPDAALLYSDARDRWPLSNFWGASDVCVLAPIGKEFKVPSEQLRVAAGIVETDVGWRDRRLVSQSKSLAVCCPKDPASERITRGVQTELDTALAVGIVSFYWQNPDWDPNKFVERRFGPSGSMGLGANEALVQQTESLNSLILAKP